MLKFVKDYGYLHYGCEIEHNLTIWEPEITAGTVKIKSIIRGTVNSPGSGKYEM